MPSNGLSPGPGAHRSHQFSYVPPSSLLPSLNSATTAALTVSPLCFSPVSIKLSPWATASGRQLPFPALGSALLPFGSVHSTSFVGSVPSFPRSFEVCLRSAFAASAFLSSCPFLRCLLVGWRLLDFFSLVHTNLVDHLAFRLLAPLFSLRFAFLRPSAVSLGQSFTKCFGLQAKRLLASCTSPSQQWYFSFVGSSYSCSLSLPPLFPLCVPGSHSFTLINSSSPSLVPPGQLT